MSAFVLIGNKIAKAECGNSTYIFSAPYMLKYIYIHIHLGMFVCTCARVCANDC